MPLPPGQHSEHRTEGTTPLPPGQHSEHRTEGTMPLPPGQHSEDRLNGKKGRLGLVDTNCVDRWRTKSNLQKNKTK